MILQDCQIDRYQWIPLLSRKKEYSMGKFDEALVDYNKALALDSLNKEGLSCRGMVEDHEGQYDLAIDDYSKAILIDPEYSIAYNNLGYTKSKLGLYREAIFCFSKSDENLSVIF